MSDIFEIKEEEERLILAGSSEKSPRGRFCIFCNRFSEDMPDCLFIVFSPGELVRFTFR